MKERDDSRVLGAIRWIDAVTLAPVAVPLDVSAPDLKFFRNLSGLMIVVSAKGLEKYNETFDLDHLAPADRLDSGSLSFVGKAEDATGTYLPCAFTIKLPRNPSPALLPPDDRRPANSLFSPIEIRLLRSPAARMAAGWAQVRMTVKRPDGSAFPNVLVRVVSTADGSVLGRGMSDERGEAVVPVPALKLFAPGLTSNQVVTSETEAKIEVILPPPNEQFVDWTALDANPVDPALVDPAPLKLKAGHTYPRTFPFSA